MEYKDNKNIDIYIKKLLSQNFTKEDIYRYLLEKGYYVVDIEQGFRRISKGETEDGVKVSQEVAHNKMMGIVFKIGAVLVAAGIFSFIAANWSEMTKTVKILVILFFLVGFYLLGWYMKYEKRLLKTGDALILLGNIVYGAGIFLVSQMYNMRVNWPDGFILWMIGVVLMGGVIKSYPLFYLSAILGIISVTGYRFGDFISYGSSYERFLFTPTILLIMATVVSFFTGLYMYKNIPDKYKKYF